LQIADFQTGNKERVIFNLKSKIFNLKSLL